MDPLQRSEETRARPAPPALLAGTVLFLLLHLAASFLFPELLWGAHHLRFLPAAGRIVWVLGVLLIVLPWSARFLWRISSSLHDRLQSKRRLAVPLLLSLLFLLFLLARTRNHFLGDGFLIASVVENPAESGMGSAGFLSLWIHRFLLRVLSALGTGAGGSAPFVLSSSLAGVIVVFLSWSAAGAIASDLRSRAVLFASCAGSGGLLLFFGYVEYYPLMQAAVLLYLLLSILYLQGRGSLWGPTIALLLAFALHASSAALAPSWLFFLVKDKGVKGKRVLFLVPVLLAGLAAAYALLTYTEKFYQGLNALIPLFREGDHSYTFFSRDHLAFVGNQILLLLGGALLLFLLSRRDRPPSTETERTVGRFLALSAALGLLYLLFLDPRLGARDWDLMALPLFPFLLFIGHLAFRGGVSVRRRSAVLLIGVVLLHTFPWVAAQTDRERAVSMVLTMIARDPHYDNPEARAPKALGVLLSRQGFHEEASLLFERAADVKEDPQNYFNLGTNLARQGEYEEAIEHLRRAVELEPGYLQARANLAVALRMTGRAEEAMAEIGALLSIAPDYAKAHQLRGHLLVDFGRTEEAIDEYEKCAEIDSSQVDCWIGLARGYTVMGEREAAARTVRRALSYNPGDERLMELAEALEE